MCCCVFFNGISLCNPFWVLRVIVVCAWVIRVLLCFVVCVVCVVVCVCVLVCTCLVRPCGVSQCVPLCVCEVFVLCVVLCMF